MRQGHPKINIIISFKCLIHKFLTILRSVYILNDFFFNFTVGLLLTFSGSCCIIFKYKNFWISLNLLMIFERRQTFKLLATVSEEFSYNFLPEIKNWNQKSNRHLPDYSPALRSCVALVCWNSDCICFCWRCWAQTSYNRRVDNQPLHC